MDPLSAVSLASAIIQIVDFSAKILLNTSEIYKATDGKRKIDRALEATTANLGELLAEVGKKSSINYQESNASGQRTADGQLLKLAQDSEEVANTLRVTLNKIRFNGNGGERSVLKQGFRTVLEQKTIKDLADKLDSIRKQVDTALLVSLQ